ncbi:hypothetical protein GCM10011519_23200 [Marmoricola endophyticus]|uniref:Helix-turn-helix domain-containing protein n=2 Tax=Marmoricola endophyticus TaxID=2040280 RepID=A0A917BLG8_9ACTN|nr:hypothetical protein GCM10011519_23200 [Marmoricola endophyticus]
MRDLTRQNPKHAEAAPEDTLLLTLDEAARELRCARRTLERYVADQQLTVVHLGRSVRVERRELERFIGRHREPTARG